MKNILFIFVACFFSCSKNDLPPGNLPVFSLSGVLNDTTFNWQAGQNDKYMLAKMDSIGFIPVFVGNLGNIFSPTTNGLPSIEIIFVGSNSGSLVPIFPNLDGNLSYATSNSPDPIIYQLAYDATNSIGLNIQNYEFNFLNEFSIQPFDFFNFLNNDVQGLATLNIKGINGAKSSKSEYVNLFTNEISGVEIIKLPNNMLFAQSSGQTPIEYKWSTSDSGQTASLTSPSNEYSVTATLPNLQKITNTIWVDSAYAILYRASMNLTYNIIVDSTQNANYQSGNVIVRYSDETGQVFSSEFVNQTMADFFKVNSISDYISNEAGVKTKQLDVNFSCQLSNSDGSAKYFFKNVSGKIAVGVPD
jgi:hypothetical protein